MDSERCGALVLLVGLSPAEPSSSASFQYSFEVFGIPGAGQIAVVPEPDAAALMALGLVFVVRAERRIRRADCGRVTG